MDEETDLHEWISFEDHSERRTWVFDVTFLTSRWSCIFGRGCRGVLTDDFTDATQGCCSYGAHFTGKKDAERIRKAAKKLSPEQWQFRSEGMSGGITETTADGELQTRLIDDACIFLNRPGFTGDGLGCAFHHAAVRSGKRHMDWMPEVCWQLPLRRIDTTDDHGHVTSTLREWKRRDWGEGGFDFHWWCTDAPDAFVAGQLVYREMADEITEMVGEDVYRRIAAHLDERLARGGSETFIPHPTVRPRQLQKDD